MGWGMSDYNDYLMIMPPHCDHNNWTMGNVVVGIPIEDMRSAALYWVCRGCKSWFLFPAYVEVM